VSMNVGVTPMHCVDAFADLQRPFSGNPAAVCLVHGDDDWMQGLAGEMNLSETAFCKLTSDLNKVLGIAKSPVHRLVLCVEASIDLEFADVTGAIRSSLVFDADVSFAVGSLVSQKGQNLGSLHVLAFAKLMGWNKKLTLRLWGEHYRAVLDEPAGAAHPNIRNFMADDAVIFTKNGVRVESPIVSFDVEVLKVLMERQSLGHMDRTCFLQAAHAAIKLPQQSSTNPDEASSLVAFLCALDLPWPSALSTQTSKNVAVVPSVDYKFPIDTVLSPKMLALCAQIKSPSLSHGVIQASLSVAFRVTDDNHVPMAHMMANFVRIMELDKSAATFLYELIYPHAAPSQAPTLVMADCASPPRFSSLSRPHVALRWMTPKVEVDLCGHATLAAAGVLFGLFHGLHQIAFDTRSGVLLANQSPNGEVELDFPVLLSDKPGPDVEKVSAALNIKNKDVLFTAGNGMDFVVLLSDEAFASHKADMSRVKALGGRGLIVTAKGQLSGVRFFSLLLCSCR